MSRSTLDLLLASARPGDPARPGLDASAVRVLARVAVLQGAAAPASRRLERRVAAALAALVVVAFTLAAPDGERARPPTGVATVGAAEVVAALAGRREARRRLIQAAGAGQEAVWSVARAGRPEALRLLRALAPGASGARVEALVAAAVAEPALAQEALDALLLEPARGAAPALARLLVEQPALEQAVVERLDRLLLRGARHEALGALVEGAAAGRLAAAVKAVERGSAGTVDALLARMAPADLSTPALGEALAKARLTLAARVVERALSGQRDALAWAAQARRNEVVPALLHDAVGEDPVRAREALERLAHVGSTDAWLALARASGGPAAARAQRLLAQLPFEAAEALERRARESARDRSAALCALAAAGPAGLARLEALGGRPALQPEVFAALADSPCAGASERLVALSRNQDSPLAAVQALGRRLARGHDEAGAALLAFAREGPRRAALEQLFAAGEHGERFLARAVLDANLAGSARPFAQRAEARAAAAAAGAEERRPSAPRSVRPY